MNNPIINDLKAKIKSNNPVTLLIIINCSVFLLINIFRILTFLSGESSLLASIENFIITNLSFPLSYTGLLHKPWTVITYMFMHIDFMHIFWNMISLFWFGQVLTTYTSSKKIIPLYLFGGIAGAIVTLLMITLIPVFNSYIGAPLLGASAGVTAIIVAAATLAPNVRMNLLFIGPVKLIYVAAFVLFIDVLNIASYSNVGGNLAHLGGAIMGFIFISQYKKGKDMGKPINQLLSWLKNLFSTNKTNNLKVVHKRKLTDEEYNYQRNVHQQEIDVILDKISKSGYESLSKKEKDILFNASKQK